TQLVARTVISEVIDEGVLDRGVAVGREGVDRAAIVFTLHEQAEPVDGVGVVVVHLVTEVPLRGSGPEVARGIEVVIAAEQVAHFAEVIDGGRAPVDAGHHLQVGIYLEVQLRNDAVLVLVVDAVTEHAAGNAVTAAIGRQSRLVALDGGIPVNITLERMGVPVAEHAAVGARATTAAAGVVHDGAEVEVFAEGGVPVEVDLRLVEVVDGFIEETALLAPVRVTPVVLKSRVALAYGAVVGVEIDSRVDRTRGDRRLDVGLGVAELPGIVGIPHGDVGIKTLAVLLRCAEGVELEPVPVVDVPART